MRGGQVRRSSSIILHSIIVWCMSSGLGDGVQFTKQFAMVSEHRDHKAATEACMGLLSDSAEKFGLDIEWSGVRDPPQCSS